jgi:pimeloyl-ACP methyl ester carboxylesterase
MTAMELRCIDEGPREGPPLFFLHGLFGNANNWAPIAARMALLGFRCLRPDARNHGLSPRTPAMGYPAMAGDLFDLAEALGIGSFALVGHSMGGKTAMEAALERPSRVERLVVVDIAPGAYEPRYEAELGALLGLELGALRSRSEADRRLSEAIPDETERRFLLANLRSEARGGCRWRIGLEEIEADYPALWAALERGRSYAGPTLFMRGGASDYIAEGRFAEMREFFPSQRLVAIEGAGHWVHSEAPDAFSDALAEFLNGPRG